MNARIWITGELTVEYGTDIAKDILIAAVNPDVEKIVLLINSGGGNIGVITPIWEMLKLAQMNGKKVVAIGMGTVASSAMAIFMMADVRIMLPNTLVLIHKASTGLHGSSPTQDELEIALFRASRATNIAWEPVIKNSYLTMELISEKCKNCDWYLSEDEIKQYGIITKSYDLETINSFVK